MLPHITTEDATKQALPRSDTTRYTHLLYKDDVCRDWGVVRLNLEALKAFSDTITIGRRHQLATEDAEFQQWFGQDGLKAGVSPPSLDAMKARTKYRNLENLKIAAGFELHLKARLLARNYVLHVIDREAMGYKELAGVQRNRPIERCELLAIQTYQFDGKENYLPGLTEASLNFSWLTGKTAYRAALELTDQQRDIVERYRLLRNQLHFPGDRLDTPSIQPFPRPIANFLVEFINREIVVWSNTLMSQHNFNYEPFALFS